MKQTFSILLFCLVFQNILTTQQTLKAKIENFAKEKIRKLENTDEEDQSSGESNNTNNTESSDTRPPPPPVIPYLPSPEHEPESADATAENAPVEVNKPVSIKRKTTENKKAQVQVTKFHGFKKPTIKGPGPISFGIFFYFFGRPIARMIILRLRITYFEGLRNLQEAVAAESARSDCIIANESLLTKKLTEEQGANVNYNCEANAMAGDAITANFTINTDIPITMINADGETESLGFEEINFNGDASNEATNLQDNEEEIKGSIYTLKETIATVEKYILKLTGKLEHSRRLIRNLAINNGDTITMKVQNYDDETKIYDCQINGVSSQTKLECNTIDDPIITTVGKVHLSSGNSTNGDLLVVEMDDWESNSKESIETKGSSRYKYFKKSGGLSGGAIAAIVIASVVALAAASIAAIMFRKPTSPKDNTTFVDLKATNIEKISK